MKIDLKDLYEIMETYPFSLGDELTEKVMEMNIEQWKKEIEESAYE